MKWDLLIHKLKPQHARFLPAIRSNPAPLKLLYQRRWVCDKSLTTVRSRVKPWCLQRERERQRQRKELGTRVGVGPRAQKVL
jgi:hypothetical protein